MKLKIGVITGDFPIPAQPYRGHSTYQILQALARDADVEVFCPFSRYTKWFRPRNDQRSADLSCSPPHISARYFEYPALPGLTRSINGLVCAKYLEPYFRKCMPDVALN